MYANVANTAALNAIICQCVEWILKSRCILYEPTYGENTNKKQKLNRSKH